jgi:hypothetical protein
VFVDESGDVGIKVDAGSSSYFTATLLVFEDHDEALAADERISRLKRDLGLPSHFEFQGAPFCDTHSARSVSFGPIDSPNSF